MARTVLSALKGLMHAVRCLRQIILDAIDPFIEY